MFKRLGVLLVVTLVASVLTVGEASAESRRVHDRADNAPPYINITRATLTNAQNFLKMTVRARDLSYRAGLDVTIDTGERGGRGYQLLSFGTVDGYFTRQYRFRRPNAPRSTNVACDGLGGIQQNGGRSRFLASVPQRCFGRDAGSVRLTVRLQKAESARSDTLRPAPVLLSRG